MGNSFCTFRSKHGCRVKFETQKHGTHSPVYKYGKYPPPPWMMHTFWFEATLTEELFSQNQYSKVQVQLCNHQTIQQNYISKDHVKPKSKIKKYLSRSNRI